MGARIVVKSFPLPGAPAQYGPDKLVHVEHIDLYLTPDLAARRMDGVCTTTVRAIDDGVGELTLDAVDFVVGSVRDADGKPLDFRRDPQTLTVRLREPLRAGERTSFAIAYLVERPRAGLHFIAPTKEHPEKPTQCWTQSQDEFARYWFPCFDHPHAKQTTSTTIVVPTGTFALGNGRLAERRDDPQTGYTTFRYVQDLPHATYLVTMVAGSFTEVEQTGADVPVFYYVAPGREEEGERSFGKTPQMVKVFERLTGMPYPYARYSQIAVADFIFGGMENTTATTQTDRTLHDARAHADFSSDPLVAHELAHQWFGDLLTTRDWSHAWLNEGFATFFETAYREADLGLDEYLYAVMGLVGTYLEEYSERYARPIVENRYHDPIEVFDRHLYEKGGAVLHMLRGTLGEDRFWRSIRHYVREFAQRSVETIDFVRAIEAATGRNLREFFDQWVHRPGHPDVRVHYEYDAQAKTATLRIEQRQAVDGDHPAFAFSLELGLCRTAPDAIATDVGGAALPGERRYVLDVETADQQFTFACDEEPELVRVDPGAVVLCTMEYAFGERALERVLSSDPSPAGRIRAARALAKSLAPSAARALERALMKDPFWGVRVEVARAVGEAKTRAGEELLLACASDPHPKVRRAVAAALGNYRTPQAATALLALAAADASYFVVAAALESLGKTRDARAFDALRDALGTTSWTDTIASGAARGLAELGDPRGVAALVAATAHARNDGLRVAALAALGRAARTSPESRLAAVDRIVECLDDESFAVRRAAIGAAERAEADDAVPTLERVGHAASDGRLRRAAVLAVRAIRDATHSTARLERMQTEMESLRADLAALRHRVDAV
jgi:aminopeptidase N